MGTDNANKDRQAIDLLFAERCSCVVRNGDTIRIFRERGVRDLWRLLHEEPELLDGAFVADKVVGKGAAALMAAGRVRELFADVVSHAALELLNGAGIPVSYTVAVPHIINRAGDGICPVERLRARARTGACRGSVLQCGRQHRRGSIQDQYQSHRKKVPSATHSGAADGMASGKNGSCYSISIRTASVATVCP